MPPAEAEAQQRLCSEPAVPCRDGGEPLGLHMSGGSSRPTAIEPTALSIQPEPRLERGPAPARMLACGASRWARPLAAGSTPPRPPPPTPTPTPPHTHIHTHPAPLRSTQQHPNGPSTLGGTSPGRGAHPPASCPAAAPAPPPQSQPQHQHRRWRRCPRGAESPRRRGSRPRWP